MTPQPQLVALVLRLVMAPVFAVAVVVYALVATSGHELRTALLRDVRRYRTSRDVLKFLQERVG